jgi:uncharacterized protein (DUF58 family)
MSHTGRTRRHIAFTREGWSFIAILAFVVFGSILRQINLLVMLASMMIPAILFNWRMAAMMIRRIVVRHAITSWVFAGRATVIELEIVNGSHRMNSWNLLLTDTLQRIAPNPTDAPPHTIDLVAVSVEAGQTSHVSYRCYFAERGIYRLGPVKIASQYPFGLVRAWFQQLETAELYVAPRLGELKPTWNKRRGALAVGMASAARRRGWLPDEFFGLRNWQHGDTTRLIHWRSSAKRGQVVVKQFDQPTDRDFALALDLHATNSHLSGSDEQVEQAISFVATVMAHLNFAVHGRAAVAVCGAQPRLFTNQVAGEFIGSVMQELAVALPSAHTDILHYIDEIAAKVSPGTPVIVVSTREALPVEGLRTNLDVPASSTERKSNVMWISVTSAEFREMFTPPGEIDFEGMPLENRLIIGGSDED